MQLNLLIIPFFVILLLGNPLNFEIYATNELVKLTASDGAAFDFFGQGVSIFCNKIAIGSFRDDDTGENSGAVYLYDLDAPDILDSEIKLIPSDAIGHVNFGQDVSIYADKMVVGAKGDVLYDYVPPGAAYLYDLDAPDILASEIKLTASDGMPNDHFGYSVSISDDKIIVGSISSNGIKTVTGAAYLYDLDAPDILASEIKLTASDGMPNDHFGYSVSISDDKIIVGAFRTDSNTGAAYLYDLDAPDILASEIKLTASDGMPNDHFGYSVSISDDKIIVGAFRTDSNTGAAYLYDLDAPDILASEIKLTASDGMPNDHFGNTVYASDDKIIVGAYGDDFLGAAYLYDLDAPDILASEIKLTASTGNPLDRFSHSLSIWDDKVAVGSYRDDDMGHDSGAAYVYLIRFDDDSQWSESHPQCVSTSSIPDWIKNNAKWWSQGTIDDSIFVSGIQYLISQKIIVIPETLGENIGKSVNIPDWIKNNAKWWSQGTIDDDSFIRGIEFLISNGILVISDNPVTHNNNQ